MDAEGRHDGVPCPRCGSVATITYLYVEGFEELECPTCGYVSDAAELEALGRLALGLPEEPASGGRGAASDVEPDSPADHDAPAYPRRSLRA